MIYLDYQATTPLAPEAREAMLPLLDSANPHSPHAAGRAARAAVEVARDRVAALLPAGGRVVFTSGATEAANWALRCAGDVTAPIVTIATEHACVLDTAHATGRAVTVLAVDSVGLAQPNVPPGTGIVAAMLVNNEIGVIQPLGAFAQAAHRAGALMFCDAVQGFGRVAIPAGCDLIAVSAHKLHGPKGIGALWVRDGVALAPLLIGGGQEAGLRGGTLSPALCAGFGAAAALAKERWGDDAAHVEALWTIALATLGPGWTLNGSADARYRGNLNVRRDGLDAARLISTARDLAISAGSACASGSGRPSHVLAAIGLDAAQARSSLRIGFGRYTTAADLRDALTAIRTIADAQ